MTTIATTIRLDAGLRQGLDQLCELRSITLNKLVSAALAQHLANDTLLLQQEFEASINALKLLAFQDPGFERAIDRVVRAEVSVSDDPAQGTAAFPEEHATTDLLRSLLNA
jgi:predicted transcriptional regulator